jgi:hypothetical protein
MTSAEVVKPSRRRATRWAAFAILIAAIVLSVVWYASTRGALERLYGGAANLAVVARPTTIKAFRLGPLPLDLLSHTAAIADHPVLAGPVELAPADAAAVSEALSSSNSYEWMTGKACMPRYGIRFSFEMDANCVDVLLCFECDILAVWRDGRCLGVEDFDNARPALVRAVRAAFPGDQEIQSLGESRQTPMD